MSVAPGDGSVDFYDSTYGRFDDELYRDIRRATWDEDFGQNGWITAAEQDRFIRQLGLNEGTRVLDVACGSGGPSLRLAERSGASVVGVDIHADGIRFGRTSADDRGLSGRVTFEQLDAAGAMPFEDGSFDVVLCVDAINHLRDRERVLTEWARLVRPGGRVLFTDPAVVTGAVSSEEIAIRSSIGFFLFVAADTNQIALKNAGLRVVAEEDVSDALFRVAGAWCEARAARSEALVLIEGRATFEGQQRFLAVASKLAGERRLSRLAYLATKSGGE